MRLPLRIAALALLLGVLGLAAPTAALAKDVYFENCAQARAAGRTDILRGQPGWRPGLESNNSGIACASGVGDLKGSFSAGSGTGRTGPPPAAPAPTPVPVASAQTRSTASSAAAVGIPLVLLLAVVVGFVSVRSQRS